MSSLPPSNDRRVDVAALSPLRIAYADPPYPGRAHLYADHPDYAGEVDHAELIERLMATYDGWALSTSSNAIQDILSLCPSDVRVVVWVKNTVRYGWEPVIVRPARPPRNHLRDWIYGQPEAFQWRPKPDSYVIGQKPEAFCMWIFEWLGAEADDEFDDLFSGSGAVRQAWERFSSQGQLRIGEAPNKRAKKRAQEKALRTYPQIEGVL